MILEKLHIDFLETWPLSRLESMTLDEYNKQGSKETFCYWVEYQTKPLANISGVLGSAKFEIYERYPGARTSDEKRYGYDDHYTWLNRGGIIKTRDEAFQYTKKQILDVVRNSISGNFDQINESRLMPIFVWKIAFLYSDYKILSIADRKVVRYLAELFDMQISKNTTTNQMHNHLMQFISRSTYWKDMRTLWELYNGRNVTQNENVNTKSLTRKDVKLKDINESIRKSNINEIIIIKLHNILQNKIYNELISQGCNAIMEENNIDILVEHQNRVDFYEVKIGHSAKNCIRQALGQIIEYSFNFETSKQKKLIIIGNHPLTPADLSYVEFISQNLFLPIEFEYQYRT